MTARPIRFARCESGATAVEFSLVVAPLLLLLLGTLQFALYNLEAQRLSNAVYDIAANGSSISAGGRDAIAEAVCRQLSLIQSCTGSLKIQIAPVGDYPSVAIPVDNDLNNSGSNGQIILLRVEANMHPFIPWVGTMPLRASAMFVRS